MSKKAIVIAGIVAIILLAGGTVWYGNSWESPQSGQDPDISGDDRSQPTTSQQASENTGPEELVWYDIPELGIRFKVTPEVKDELVYYKDPSLHIVNFSTKALESISKHCSAANGPLGGISRVYGTPADPNAPCGGGHKMKEFGGGYFCYTTPQAPCTQTDSDYVDYEKPADEKYWKLFQSEDFWKTVEVR